MTIRIACPNCGERALGEFRYGGEIPVVPDGIVGADARDVDRVWMRGNPEGRCVERWFHELGCRRWLTLARDTRTDEVLEPPVPDPPG
jgi:heterotetrameric sarcosine oxidase delta subunit